MNGYKFERIVDENIQETLGIAVGIDKETPGLVSVDLVIPKYNGAYRFTAHQFDMFTYFIVGAAKMAKSFAMVFEALSLSLEGEDEEVVRRVMDRVAVYVHDYAAEAGGHEPDDDPEEEIPFGV